MDQAGHLGDALLHEVAVHRGRRAEGGHGVPVDDGHKLPGVEIVEVEDHHSAAAEPLPVELAPGGLPPAGLGHGEVEAAVLNLLPVLGGEDMGQRVGVVVHDRLGVPGGAGGEVENHRLGGQGLLTLQCIWGSGHLARQVVEALPVGLGHPEMLKTGAARADLQQVVAHRPLGGADGGLDVGQVHPVGQIVGGEHMGHGDQHRPQLVQGDGDEPVLIVALEDHHHLVAPADALGAEDIGRLVAETADILKGEDALRAVGVAPDHRPLLRVPGGDGVHHVVAEVVVLGAFDAKARQAAVRAEGLLAELLIELHCDNQSFIGSRLPA